MRPILIPLIAQLTEAVSTRDVTQVPTVSLAEGAACACAQLSNAYANLTLFSNSTNYVAEATNYWDIRSDLLPECIFLPTSEDQVAHAVTTLASCGAQFAMRGCGHMNVRFFINSAHDFCLHVYSFPALTALMGACCLL